MSWLALVTGASSGIGQAFAGRQGAVVNVAGMIVFAGPADASQMPRRAAYAGTLAHIVAMSQTLHAELEGTGVDVHVVCPGVVATEFHEVQGLDLSAPQLATRYR